VLYAGSFSKVLFPALRLGYMVVPDRLVETFTRASCSFHAGAARLEQAVVARFMSEGHFARHLKRMRSLYGARRAALADALAAAFGGRLRVDRQPGGMHLLARPIGNARDTELVHRAERHGLAPAALSPLSINSDCGQGLLLSFTNIPEDRAPELVGMLRRAIANP
jgi:GntR family transcriptional regulator/MocR family aminotransferase